MPFLKRDGVRLHYRLDGPDDGAAVVFANALGTDLSLWDLVLPLLKPGLRILRFDMRGHGLSDCPTPPYSMGQLITDAEALMDHVNLRDSIFIGLSLGGMIAQGLAAKRLDLVRAVVLSNTAAKIGTRQNWQDRINVVEKDGLAAICDANMQRWFSKKFRASDNFPIWRDMFLKGSAQGWCGCAAAIAGSDFIASTSTLRLPCLAIAGSEDRSTPPDLVRETADLIPGSTTVLIRGAGHVPCVDTPQAFAEHVNDFLTAQGIA